MENTLKTHALINEGTIDQIALIFVINPPTKHPTIEKILWIIFLYFIYWYNSTITSMKLSNAKPKANHKNNLEHIHCYLPAISNDSHAL